MDANTTLGWRGGVDRQRAGASVRDEVLGISARPLANESSYPIGQCAGEWQDKQLLAGVSVDDGRKESKVNSKVIIGLLLICNLAISGTSQEINPVQPQSGAIISLPSQQSRGTTQPPTLQVPDGGQDAKPYPQQLESVLTTMSAELAEIAKAVHEGQISREQGEYLSLERYYVAMTRFQFLRTMYQGPDKPNQTESYSQPNVAPQFSTDAVSLPTLTCTPDLSQQLIEYLQLNASQIEAFQAKVTDQCKQVQPLMERLEQSRRKEILIKLSGKFDAQQAQALASEQSVIMKDLLVANSQLETKLYNMLTSDQKQKVDGLLRQSLGFGASSELREQ